jgi:hypothetical protein
VAGIEDPGLRGHRVREAPLPPNVEPEPRSRARPRRFETVNSCGTARGSRPPSSLDDTLRVTTASALAGDAPPPAGSYQGFVRLEISAPRGALHAEAFDKLHRKLEERIQGVRWRVPESHLPVAGGVRPGPVAADEVIEDRSRFAIPRDAAPGRWDVHVRMIRTPHHANLGVRDYLRDDDFNGPVVGRVTIVPSAQSAEVRP